MLKHNLLELPKKHYSLSKIIFFTMCVIMSSTKVSSQETLAHKLGYASNTKLLIIHADDLGFSHTENTASIKAMEEGFVNSASIIMPGPWVTEMSTYAKNNKETHDLGLHLAITSEWDNYKWKPVASKGKIPTLVNEFGYFHKSCPANASVAEIEIELRAQIDLAYVMGIEPTHLDSHMGCLFWSKPEFFEVYLKLAQEYNIPCLVDDTFVELYPSKENFEQVLKKYEVAVVLNQILTISPEEFNDGPVQYYTSVLKSLKPGLSTILIHTAYDNGIMQAITVNQPDWGAAWRQADYDFFMSVACKKILKDENIVLVTWREISKVLYK